MIQGLRVGFVGYWVEISNAESSASFVFLMNLFSKFFISFFKNLTMKYLYTILFCFQSVFSEYCNQQLFKELDFSFDLSKICDDVCVFDRSMKLNSKWLGTCLNNKNGFAQKLLCRTNTFELFVRVTRNSCRILSLQNITLNFNASSVEQCREDTCKITKLDLTSYAKKYAKSPLKLFKKPIFRKRPTSATKFSTFLSTPTYFTATESIPDTTLLPPTTFETFCEEDEIFFKNHCYFCKLYGVFKDEVSVNFRFTINKTELFLNINSTSKCMEQHPNALGLAVETEEENKFILEYLSQSFPDNQQIILTSGTATNSEPGIWEGWNKLVNTTILKIENIVSYFAYYFIAPSKKRWFLSDFKESSFFNKTNFSIMCERHYNPLNVIPELYLKCLEEYRKSKCYSKKEHKKFCCVKDHNGAVWFACPRDLSEKMYLGNTKCIWYCGSDGLFLHEYPICTGKTVCHTTYMNIKFSAPINKFAISNCPDGLSGNSSWYCGKNRIFQGLPDFNLCCDGNINREKMCKKIDKYLRLWMGCPGKTVFKIITCPPGSFYERATAQWHCFENGTFKETFPDYSRCNFSNTKCFGRDKFGRLWEGELGEIVEKECPPLFNGFCYWKCNKSGHFETFEPDFSECCPGWVEVVEDMISNGTGHQKIMDAMDNFTKTQDLKFGFAHILNLTFKCVQLFKRQNSGHINVFEEFLQKYSKILKNIANSDVWFSFSASRRKNYASNIIEITQNATFANLEKKNGSILSTHNVTLASFKKQGFDFFVLYNPEIIGTKFPLENYDESDWQLEVKEVNVSGKTFAVMGLVMNYSLSSLMFPQNNNAADVQINSQVLTFSVAVMEKNGPKIIPDVSVHVFFKHLNKTRFPKTEIIRRKLHSGEAPSGINNSTICFYYTFSYWSTEGCEVTFSSNEQTNCSCKHLSTIGLLMSIHKYVPNHILEMVSLISSGITIVSLILALFVFFLFDSVKNERLLIEKNLCFCLLVGHIMLVCVMDKRFFYISDNLCTIYAILLHYVFMAAFAWMFVEGCHLYRMLVLVFDSSIEFRWIYLLIGYGGPLVVVGVTELTGFIFQEQPYGQDELCWLKAPNYIWAFIGPVVFITSINFLISLIAMKLAISSKMKTEKSNFSNFKIWIKGWISLSTLLGVTWLFGLSYMYDNEICVYGFVVLNGLQGLFIFLFRCVFTEHYKTVFIQKLKSWFPDFQFSECKMQKLIKMNSKMFSASQNGSKFTSGHGGTDSGYGTTTLSCLNDKTHIQKDILKTLDKFSSCSISTNENSCAINADLEITVTPAASEEYLRKHVMIKSTDEDYAIKNINSVNNRKKKHKF